MSNMQKMLQGYLNELLSDDDDQQKNGKSEKNASVSSLKPHAPQKADSIARAPLASAAAQRPKKVAPSIAAVANPKAAQENAPLSTIPQRPDANVRSIVKQKPQFTETDELKNNAPLPVLETGKKHQLQKMLSQPLVTENKKSDSKDQETLPKPVVAQSAKQIIVQEQEVAISHDTEIAAKPGKIPPPDWAEHPFEALLFDVAGLSLAVPLVTLGQIVPLDKKLTVLQGQSAWFMGILSTPIGDIRTVNTALFVMPERYNDAFLESAKYVVTINNMPWGLAVDSVNQPVTLRPDEVKWRTGLSSKRPWLAGTVKSHMCTLIDITQMAQMLEQSDKRRR